MIQQKTKKIQAENVFIWSFKHIDFKKNATEKLYRQA
mgnify:CR=1 FL=1